MEVRLCSLLELLQTRVLLAAILNSTNNFLHVDISQKIPKIKLKLKEIDKELMDRILEDRDTTQYCDENLLETLKQIRNEEPK